MVEITKKYEELDSRKDIALLSIKPEPILDGRAERIISWIEDYCESNRLSIAMQQKAVGTAEHILVHYGGPGKLEEVGKKVIGAIRMSSPERRARAEAAGLTSLPLEELGERVKQIELGAYAGKELIVLIIIGRDAASKIRSARGASDPKVSGPGTIRREFSSGMGIVDILLDNKPLDNVVHVPLNYEELETETRLLFGKSPDAMLRELISENGRRSFIRN